MVHHRGDLGYSNESYTHVDENDNICVDLNKTKLKNEYLPDKCTSIVWRNLQYNVKQFPNLKSLKYSTKTILRSLNGSFATNTLNGLMGPSGSVSIFFVFKFFDLFNNFAIILGQNYAAQCPERKHHPWAEC